MNLGDTAIGQTVTVTRLGGERPFRRRLMELGLLPGTRVQVVRVAPLGDPLELRVRGCLLSIRRDEARTIDVTREAEPARAAEGRAALPLSPSVPAAP